MLYSGIRYILKCIARIFVLIGLLIYNDDDLMKFDEED